MVVPCLPAGQMGTNSAAAVASQTKSRFLAIRFGLMASGVPNDEADIRLGDGVISQPYLQYGGLFNTILGRPEKKEVSRERGV